MQPEPADADEGVPDAHALSPEDGVERGGGELLVLLDHASEPPAPEVDRGVGIGHVQDQMARFERSGLEIRHRVAPPCPMNGL